MSGKSNTGNHKSRNGDRSRSRDTSRNRSEDTTKIGMGVQKRAQKVGEKELVLPVGASRGAANKLVVNKRRVPLGTATKAKT